MLWSRASHLNWALYVMRNHAIFVLLLVYSSMVQGNMTIQAILEKDNYAVSEWDKRGLIPSPIATIQLMDKSTKSFLKELKAVDLKNTQKDDLYTKVLHLVDKLPWDDLDTEEREFLADTIVPAIESLGLDAWSMM